MSINQIESGVNRLPAQSLTTAETSAPPPSEIGSSSRQDETVVNGSLVPPTKESEDDNQAKISQAVAEINEFVQNIQRSVHFSVDDESGKTVIRVVDRETNELIRQIPTEEVLNIARSLEEQITANKSEGIILRVQA